MNLFVIPTWYPHRCFPLEGVYVHDQAVAIGELRENWNVVISLWGQGESFLSLPHLMHSPGCLAASLRSRHFSRRALRQNVVQYRTSTLAWSDRFRRGNRDGILRTNRAHVARALDELGGIDVLHAHVSYPAGWIAMHLSNQTGIPFVLTEHMGPFPLPSYAQADGSLAPMLREPLERAAARIAVSPALSDRITEFGISKPDYVPNLIDERRYQVTPRDSGKPFVFFTLCGMQETKGIHDLLEAAALFLARLSTGERDRVVFRLGGEGPALGAFQSTARRLGIDRSVRWLGLLSRDEARREFASCACFVLPSHHESFGVVFVEAMACGRPVIATRCGGPETIVAPGTGLLVDVGRRDQLADALESLFREPDRFDPVAIRESFLARFSRIAVVDRLEAIYRAVIAGRKRAWSDGMRSREHHVGRTTQA